MPAGKESPLDPLTDAWRRSCDAYLGAAAKTLEAALGSKEYLEMSRNGLELLCGHRERMAAAIEEFRTIPARPTTPRKTKKHNGRREP